MSPVDFQTVVADPPWQYTDKVNAKNAIAGEGRRGAAGHYATMSITEVCALGTFPGWVAGYPVAKNAHCYLWVTNAFMREGFSVLDAWGFSQRTILTWVKPGIGMGHYFRNNTEHVLFGVRGSLPARVRNLPTAFTGPRRAHSQKPAEFFRLVEALSPGPYLELFSRTERPNWKSWGLERGTMSVGNSSEKGVTNGKENQQDEDGQ